MRRRGQRGFTMVEVLVSLILATIAMVGVIALYRTSTNASSFSRHTTEATVLAQARLEHLRTQNTTMAATAEAPLDEMGKTGTGGIYTRTSTVTAVGNYFDMTVLVEWPEEGSTRSLTLRGRRNVP